MIDLAARVLINSRRCTYNCYPKANVNKRTVIESECSGPLCEMFTRYQWFLHKTYSTNPDARWTAVENLPAKTLTKLSGPNFVLKGNEQEHSLEPNAIYKATVFAFIGEEKVKEDQVIFKTNSPPFTYDNGGCSASPSDGLTLQTSFLVNCSRWHDTDLPLTYTFR